MRGEKRVTSTLGASGRGVIDGGRWEGRDVGDLVSEGKGGEINVCG